MIPCPPSLERLIFAFERLLADGDQMLTLTREDAEETLRALRLLGDYLTRRSISR